MNKYIFTFGSEQLPEISMIVNPMNIMLIVEAKAMGLAREIVMNSFIGIRFCTSYEYDMAKEFKEKYGMFECKFENLIKFIEEDKSKNLSPKEHYDLLKD